MERETEGDAMTNWSAMSPAAYYEAVASHLPAEAAARMAGIGSTVAEKSRQAGKPPGVAAVRVLERLEMERKRKRHGGRHADNLPKMRV